MVIIFIRIRNSGNSEVFPIFLIIYYSHDCCNKLLLKGKIGQQLINNPNNKKLEFNFLNESKQAAGNKYASVTKTSSKDKDNSDLDSDQENEENGSENSKIARSRSLCQAYNDEEKLKKHCITDLKAKAKEICIKIGEKYNINIFKNEMFKEMADKLPTHKEDLVKITYFTKSMFEKYEGDEFLAILVEYSKRREEMRQDEIKKKQAAYQQAQESLKSKAYLPTTSFNNNYKTAAGLKSNKGYGLVDDNNTSNIDYNPSSSKSKSYAANKKRAPSQSNSTINKTYKKARTSFGGGGGDESNTSGYSAKKSSFKKTFKKKYNFKSKYKK